MRNERLLRLRQSIVVAAVIAYFGVQRLVVRWFDRSGRRQHRLSQRAGFHLLRGLGAKVDVEGLDHIEGLQNYCVVSNHGSYLDWAVLLGHFPRSLRFIAKKELTRMPFIGGYLAQHGVLVDRARGVDAAEAIAKAARNEQAQSFPIAIFPEGTCSYRGAIRKFRTRGLQTLADAGLDFVPVCLLGTFDAYPRHARCVRPNSSIRMLVGPPIRLTDYDSHDEAISAVEAWIREHYTSAG